MKKSFFFFIAILTLNGCGGGGSEQNLVTPVEVVRPKLSNSQSDLNFFSNGQVHWVNGDRPLGGQGAPIDNVNCLKNEDYHIHVHLSIIFNSNLIQIPAGIGLTGCAYEIHTHDVTGVIHVETSSFKKFTLGEFLSVWGVTAGANNFDDLVGEVSVFINDSGNLSKWEGNINDVEFIPHREITIFVGPVSNSVVQISWPYDL